MDELAKRTDPAASLGGARRSVEDVQRDNLALKETILSLQQRLLAEKRMVAHERFCQRELRDANQTLVLALFEAENAKAAAEAANRRQTEFLSMLAHELRNPLASISVAGNVIESLKIEHVRLGKLLAIVRRQVSHLLRLVDDLLDVARINTGRMSLQARRIVLSDVIDSALETAHGSLLKREQTVAVTLPAQPVHVHGDLIRLAQLFSNLIINASKFSPPRGTIQVSAEVGASELAVRVKDNGKGIAAQYQSSIFDLFAQGAGAPEHVLAGGLGIGLALVRMVAQMHGGAVRVESEGEGCGSAFVVTLPLP